MKFLLLLTSVIAVFTVDPGDIPGKPGSEPDHTLGDHSPADQTEYYSDELLDRDSQNSHNEPDVRTFAEDPEVQKSIEGPVLFTDGPPSFGSYEVDKKHMKETTEQNEMVLRGKKQDEILKQLSKSLETFKYIMTHAYSEHKVELETIKEHQTNITNVGSALKEDQLSIKNNQKNITDTVTEFKEELQSLRDHQDNNTAELELSITNNQKNISATVTEFQEELQSLRDHQDNNTAELHQVLENITDSNSKLETEINSMKQKVYDSNSMNINMNNTMSLIISKLDSIKAIRACPSGFYWLMSSNQCFKMYNDSYRSFASASAKCQTEGLLMAEPKDPVTVGTYFMEKYNLTQATWVGARGDGSYLRWQRGGDPVPSDSSLWYGNDPSGKVSSSYCLAILTYPNYMKPPYTNVYHSTSCGNRFWTLCEYVNSG